MNVYRHLFKLALIGSSGCGKSSLMKRACYDDYREKEYSTIGVDLGSCVVKVNNSGSMVPVKFQIWDTAGLEKYNSITTQYYNHVSGFILCYDASNLSSLVEVKTRWLEQIKSNTNTDTYVIMLVGCKTDKVDDASLEEIKNKANDIVKENDKVVYSILCSAKSGENVKNMLTTFSYYLFQNEKQKDDANISIKITKSSQRKKCC